MIPSSRWRLTIDTEDTSLTPSNPDEALRLAGAIDFGELAGTGENGDCVQLQFNREHAFVLYMGRDETIYRPHFPKTGQSGEGVEEFFCEHCGVQLGDRTELLAHCTDRDDGFSICREILGGNLPQSSEIEWVELRARRKHGA